MKIKKIISLILALLICSVTLPAFAVEQEDIRVFVNGKLQTFDAKPLIINGRTMVPLRGIFEALGAEVSWEEATGKVFAKKGETDVELTIGSGEALVSGDAKALDALPIISDGRTLVPLRFISEAFGCMVEWDSEREAAFVYDTTEKILSALKASDDLCGKDVLEFVASLYDPGTGGFYYSISARDNEGYLPDLESTYQATWLIQQGGMIGGGKPSYDIMPEKIQEGLVNFARNLQEEDDGYFYHPQWGRNVSDSRKNRDLNWARALVTKFGGTFKYSLPEERINKEENTAKPMADTTEGTDERYSSKEAFIKYLDSFDWETGGWGAGNTLASQITQIKAAGLFETAAEYLAEKQNMETGLWGEGLTYSNTNAAMKISAFFNSDSFPYPNLDKMIDSVIYIVEHEDVPTYITDVWNPIVTVNQAKASYSTIPADLSEKLRESLPTLIKISTDNAKLFKRDDGGFGYNRTKGQDVSQGVKVSTGANESDMNGTLAACTSMRNSLYALAGLSAPPIYDVYDEWFMQELLKRPVKEKESVKTPEYVPTQVRPYDANAVGCKETFEDVTVGYLPGGGWKTTANVGSVKVTTDPNFKQNKALRLFKDTDGIISASLATNCGENPEIITVSFDFMVEEASGDGVFYNNVGGVFEWCITNASKSDCSISTRASGSGYGSVLSRIDYDTWYNLKIEYTPSKPLIKVYLDDVKIYTTSNYYGYETSKSGPPKSIGSVNFTSFISGTGELFVDNVTLTVD